MNSTESECFFLPLCDGYLVWPSAQDQRPYISIRINDKLKVRNISGDVFCWHFGTWQRWQFSDTRHWTSFVKFYMLCTISKETELGDWSSEKEQWCFREVPTVTVTTGETHRGCEGHHLGSGPKRWNLHCHLVGWVLMVFTTTVVQHVCANAWGGE